ncbi:Chloramphenicol resistance protein [Clostridium neonatale]|uniref:chloramphenicol resistance protein n=1 Tax=Clostridium neonatale TaxID=137838 RepID=UPI00291B6323|nr:chloramphenicol resistance protein [Clostridium neonatale]CAI3674690.1 Chloramphenicol resistance protein [Clostridium neonatale]
MKIIEAIRDYISKLDCMSTFENAINVNYLAGEYDNFSIEEIPCNPIIKRYLDGTAIRQFQFVFCSREPYSAKVLLNIENSTFYEDFADEIESKNNEGILPLLENGEALKIEVISSAYTVNTEEDTSMYQINLNFKYIK